MGCCMESRNPLGQWSLVSRDPLGPWVSWPPLGQWSLVSLRLSAVESRFLLELTMTRGSFGHSLA